MGVVVRVTDLSPDEHLASYGAGSLIRLERSATEGGVYVEVATAAIVAETYTYDIADAGGTNASWYRWRASNAGNTLQSTYSDPWSPATTTSYATLEELLLRLDAAPSIRETRRLARLTEALQDANDALTAELGGYTFHRTPTSGADTVRLFDGEGDGVLHVHGGIIELTSTRVKLSAFNDFMDVDDVDWRLEYWADRGSPHAKPADEPYDHVVFTGIGTQRYWPRGDALVELTAAYGWPKPPRRAKKAEVDLARNAVAGDKLFSGSNIGPVELGRPQGPTMLPRSVYDLSKAMSQRFWCDL